MQFQEDVECDLLSINKQKLLFRSLLTPDTGGCGSYCNALTDIILTMPGTDKPLLTCVIPVSRMQNQLGHLSQTLLDCFAHNVHVVLVHDKQDSVTGEQIVALQGFKQLSNSGLMTYLEDCFKGPGPTRNAGLSMVSTRWLVFWDADDAPIVDKVLNLIKTAEKIGAVSALGNFQEIDFRSGAILRTNIIEDNSDLPLVAGMNPGLWRWAFQTSYIKDQRFPNIVMGEDQLFLVQISPFLHKVYLDRNIVYRYSKDSC